MSDRKLEIYPNNITINKSNCVYKAVNLEKKRFYYECNFNNESYNNEIDLNNSDDVQESNFIKYFLDLINYKILICFSLLFNNKKYKYNIGFIICVIDYIFIIILIMIFFIYDFKKIRVYLYKAIPTQLKLLQIIKSQKKRMKKFVENNIFFNKSEKTNKNYINSPNQIILLRDNISNEKTAKKNDKIEKNKKFCNKKKKKFIIDFILRK